MDCNIDQELKLFVSRHSARFSADTKGKKKQANNVHQSHRESCSRQLFQTSNVGTAAL